MSRITSLLGLIVACGMVPALAQAESTLAFTGFSVSPDSWYAHAGATTALNKDLYKDGFLLRGSVGGGQYDYQNGAGSVDGDIVAADVMVGYQHYFKAFQGAKNSRVTGYIGGDFQNHDLSPNDPTSRVSGSDYGVKGQGEINLGITNKIGAEVLANYSTAYNTYWSRARVGYDLGSIAIGPEAAFLGNKGFDQQRYGAFGSIPLTKNVIASIGGGFAESSRRGEDGGYGDVSVSFTF